MTNELGRFSSPKTLKKKRIVAFITVGICAVVAHFFYIYTIPLRTRYYFNFYPRFLRAIYIRRYSNVTRAKKVSFFFHFQLTFVNDVIGSSSSKGGESEGTISTNSTKLVPIKQQNGIPNRKSKVRRTLITYAIKNSSIMS